MGRDRKRVLALALVTVGLLLVAALIFDWHELHFAGQKLSIDLRVAHACDARNVCVSLPVHGTYATVATATLWGGLVLAAMVGVQAAYRVVNGAAIEQLAVPSYLIAVAIAGFAALTGFLFAPDLGVKLPGSGVLTFERTLAPMMMIAGSLLAMVTTYYAANEAVDDVPPARVVAAPPPVETSEPGRAKRSTAQPIMREAAPSRFAGPIELRGALAFATSTVELSGGGVDARREDGTTLLVLWRDVVGLVARRLPPERSAFAFVDVVSRGGSTLRILPWTRVQGAALAPDDPNDGGERHARSIIEAIRGHCPDTQLDPATRAFTDGGPCPQLPDLATLSAHDERLS